jgi:hypothetical protein
VNNDTVHHAPGDDSSQDPAQPAVGPAIQFEKLVVPDDAPGVGVPAGPPGELIDQRRAELEREASGK